MTPLKNVKTIDERIQAEYAPKFRSPTGTDIGNAGY